MCGDCWNAAMGAPAAAVAARFAWVGYKDRIPFVKGRAAAPAEAPVDEPAPVEAPGLDEPELVDSDAAPR